MAIKILENKIFKNHPRTILASLIGFFLLMTWLVSRPQNKNATEDAEPIIESIDTYIPSGFVLVPISVQNLASLDSIVGQYGVVDLYAEGENSAIARELKLIRSPKDPSQFAVLVPEHQAKEIMRVSAKPFQVIVQNPSQSNSQVRKSTQSRIIWEK